MLFKKRLAIASTTAAFGLTALVGFMSPATAAPTRSAASAITGVGAANLPNVNIKGVPAKWNPTSISVSPKNYTTCTKAKVVWTITNHTKKGQTISYSVGSSKKTVLGTLAAGKKAGLCSKGPAGTAETFYIKGSSSTLALTLK